MRKNFYILSLVASCAALLAVSCQKVDEDITPGTESGIHTLSVHFPKMTDENGTKVSLATTGKAQWEVGDKIVIYGNPSSSDVTKRVVHEIVAADIDNPEVAVFDVDLSGLDVQYNSGTDQTYFPYTVAYPYIDGQQYYSSTGNNNYGRSRFQNTNQILMAGHVSDDNSTIVLNHLTAAITFSVDGDFDSYTFSGADGTEVVGYSTFVVEMNRRTLGEGKYRQKYNNGGTTGDLTSIQGTVNGNGTAVNYIYLPVNAEKSGDSYILDSQRYANVAYLPKGFTIKFYKGGILKKYITSKAPLVIEPGHMINLGVLPADKMKDYVAPTTHDSTIDLTNATDLSASASANCYIVYANDTNNQEKVFKFKAVKGNSNVSVGNVESVSLVWETYDNAESVTANSVINEVDYDLHNDDCYIVFKMPSTLHSGNALIAAKNSLGDILWSWHIWVPETNFTVSDLGGITSQPMMSRNLGALVDTVVPSGSETVDVRSFGLFYQWGRKDPFQHSRTVESTSRAKVAGADRTTFGGQMTIAETIANPTVWANFKGDWLADHDNELWGDSGDKTIYDPCPAGYRVAKRPSSDSFWNDVTSLSNFEANSTAAYWKIGDAVFPLSGYIYYDGGITNPSYRSVIWNSHRNNDEVAYDQYVFWDTEHDPNSWLSKPSWGQRKACGGNVRCVTE